MNTHDSLGNGVGGGEVLEYWGQSGGGDKTPYLNNNLIQQYNLVPIILIIIAAIILFVMIRVIMRNYRVRSLRKGKGIVREIENIESIRRRDKTILYYNRMIAKVTKLVEGSIFRSNKSSKEYLDYNLDRAGVKIPGGARAMKAEEWNALVVVATAAIVAVAVVFGILANLAIGLTAIIFTLIMANIMPMTYLRQVVKSKDNEIRLNFSDFYLMIHYVLLARAKTPLVGVMKSYAKTTDSKEMQHMVDVCVHYMETYGEYQGTRYIAKAYREIPVMGKLMRLIRQSNDGGEVESELMGFRRELLDEKRYEIQKRTDKIINRAKASFNLLLPILFQAILSAMSIYLSDMGLISTFVQ